MRRPEVVETLDVLEILDPEKKISLRERINGLCVLGLDDLRALYTRSRRRGSRRVGLGRLVSAPPI